MIIWNGFKDEDEFVRGYDFSFINQHSKIFINYFRNKNMWNEVFYFNDAGYILSPSEISSLLKTECLIWQDENVMFLLDVLSVNEEHLLFEHYYSNKDWMVVRIKGKNTQVNCPCFVVLPEHVFLKYSDCPDGKRLQSNDLIKLKNEWDEFVYDEYNYDYYLKWENPKEFLISGNEKWMQLVSSFN